MPNNDDDDNKNIKIQNNVLHNSGTNLCYLIAQYKHSKFHREVWADCTVYCGLWCHNRYLFLLFRSFCPRLFSLWVEWRHRNDNLHIYV